MADPSKTEKATPKKRRDERKKGNVFLSKDAVSVFTLIGALSIFALWAGNIAEQMARFLSYSLSLSDLGAGSLQGILREIGVQGAVSILKIVGPIAAVTIFCAVAATFFQTKFLVAGEQLKPKFSRISPLQGIKRLFSLRSVIEAVKGLLKIGILMVFIFISVYDMFPESPKYFYTDLSVAAANLMDRAWAMIIKIFIAFVALAALDYMYQKWDYERNLRMSKQEVKEEYKQLEGDPKVKGKIKEIQRRRAMSRMMQQVPQADVVIRNPTHYAVALRYRPEEDNAPIVLAMGQDELALRIVKIAEENQVAVIENVALARALYAQADLNKEIPVELYGAVAEVLVYIFKLNDKKQIVK